MILLIDNYDSFTYNLSHYIEELGYEVIVKRNDEIDVEGIISLNPEKIVISPGPATPDESGISLKMLESGKIDNIPILGVCLGHQAIAQAEGGNVIRADKVMHGKTSEIYHDQKGIFKNIKTPFIATRYHSLIVERSSLPDCFKITAETEDKIIMAIEHKNKPFYGVQFHPESIASEYGHELLKNFLEIKNVLLKPKNSL